MRRKNELELLKEEVRLLKTTVNSIASWISATFGNLCELKTLENENKNNCNILLVINKVRNRELEMLFYRVHGQSVCSIHNLV
jgi:hypothetical protein